MTFMVRRISCAVGDIIKCVWSAGQAVNPPRRVAKQVNVQMRDIQRLDYCDCRLPGKFVTADSRLVVWRRGARLRVWRLSAKLKKICEEVKPSQRNVAWLVVRLHPEIASGILNLRGGVSGVSASRDSVRLSALICPWFESQICDVSVML